MYIITDLMLDNHLKKSQMNFTPQISIFLGYFQRELALTGRCLRMSNII